LEAIVDRGIVYTHWANQRRWLRRTRREYGIRNLVLVGGESSRIRYPGPPVTRAAELIREELHREGVDYFLGGITLPGRRAEPERLLEKARCGIEFFTSQVLYEAQTPQRLLRAYAARCREEGVRPRRIFLSFAPVSSRKDLEFLQWLGVEIPERVEKEILNGWIGTAWRSIRVAERVLGEILAFARDEGLDVPLGINVEHVMKHNFEVSRDMVLALGELYCRYLKCRRGRMPVREGVRVRLR
jgi:5,10-methylenetetrahydrofolate reductase